MTPARRALLGTPLALLVAQLPPWRRRAHAGAQV